MMLGKREQTTAPVEKRYTSEKVAKRKKITIRTGYNPKVVSARPPPPNAEIKWYDQTGGINLQQCIIISPCTCSRRISELNQPRRSRRQSEWAKDHGT